MNIINRLLFIILLLSIGIAYGDKISAPPQLPDEPVAEQIYLREIYNNFHVPEVTTTAPNNNRTAIEGQLIFYDNSGTYELWVKTDTDSTDWQKIGP